MWVEEWEGVGGQRREDLRVHGGQRRGTGERDNERTKENMALSPTSNGGGLGTLAQYASA